MKVLIVGLYNNSGGIEKCIYDYVSHLDFSDLVIGFIGAPIHIWYENEFKNFGCKIHPICSRKKVIRYYNELCNIIKKNNYEIIHINMLSCANCIPLFAARKCGIKIICHSHNSSMPAGSFISIIRKILHKINKRQVRKGDVVKISCSKDAGKFLFGDNCHFTILSNAINTKKFQYNAESRLRIRKEFGISDDAFVIGQVGRFEYQKNHSFSIKLFAELLKKKENCILLLVGAGKLENKIKKDVINFNISSKVIFCGIRSDISEILSAMDLFLFPSFFEGLSLAGIEAQCSGLPVIASLGISKEMEQTDLVYWNDLKEPLENWVVSICNALSTYRLRKNYASRIYESGYEISVRASELKNIYKSCLK